MNEFSSAVMFAERNKRIKYFTFCIIATLYTAFNECSVPLAISLKLFFSTKCEYFVPLFLEALSNIMVSFCFYKRNIANGTFVILCAVCFFSIANNIFQSFFVMRETPLTGAYTLPLNSNALPDSRADNTRASNAFSAITCSPDATPTRFP